MEDIVAVCLKLKSGERRFFLTWGRIQDTVDPGPLEKLVLRFSTCFDLGGEPNRARLCGTLQEARNEPYFFEAFFSMCQKRIPFGVKTYWPWKAGMNKKMRKGNELYYLGKPLKEAPGNTPFQRTGHTAARR